MTAIYTALTVIVMFFDRLLCTVSTLEEIVPQGLPGSRTQHSEKAVVS